MAKYHVSVREIVTKHYEVEAENEDVAKIIYPNGKLLSEKLHDVEFYIYETESKE